MELKEFIKETLVQLVEGVKDAQKETSDSGAVIVPDGIRTSNISEYYMVAIEKVAVPVYHVDFEVALTHSDGKEDKGGIGVWFGSVGVGGQVKTDGNEVSATNVKFRIPIILPVSN